eukprot:6355038-Pyramimonas_sp.AAC.1
MQPGAIAAPEVKLAPAAQPGGAGSQERANSTPAQPTHVEPPPSPTVARPVRARAAAPTRFRAGTPDES